MIAGDDTDRTCGLVPELAQAFDLGLNFVEVRSNRPQQTLPCIRRRYAPCCAREQTNANAFLESSNRVTQCRRRDAELGRGPCEAALSRNCEKCDQITKRVARHY